MPPSSRRPAARLAEAAARALQDEARRTVAEAAERRRASAADDADVPRTIPLIPGEVTPARRAKFALANSFTIASLMLGMSAIFLSMHHDVRLASVALMCCVVFDGLDGAVARKLGVASPFGAQMDSLADMCSFGIAAPVVVYASLRGTAPTALIAVACAMIAAGAMIRLARFNVSPKDGRFFTGVPTTLTAAVLGMAVLIGLHLPGGGRGGRGRRAGGRDGVRLPVREARPGGEAAAVAVGGAGRRLLLRLPGHVCAAGRDLRDQRAAAVGGAPAQRGPRGDRLTSRVR